MSSVGDYLELFMLGQQSEEGDDAVDAAQHYNKLIKILEKGHSPRPADVSDDALQSAAAPPSGLIAAMALTSLGGLHLDSTRLDDARRCFLRSLDWWPSNGMALLNLGDLEREHGSPTIAMTHYKTAAALPPFEHEASEVEAESDDGDEADDDKKTRASAAAMAPDEGEEGSDEGSEEEEEEGEEEESWFAQWVGTPRVDTVGLASYMCALLHQQALAFDDALPYLRRFARVRYHIAPAVWRVAAHRALRADRLVDSTDGAVEASDAGAVRRFDGGVPAALLDRLRDAFAVASPFWSESGYAGRGYFSFWYDVSRPPRSIVERLAQQLLPLTGCAEEVVGCEWWVHTRAEGRSIGHQMHFDTEEATLQRGDILHPLVSSVTYLSGSPTRADPTLVLDQRVDDDACGRAWVSHPQVGATLFFPGDRLHCVIPAAPPTEEVPKEGAASSAETATSRDGNGRGRKRARATASTGQAGGSGARNAAASLTALTPSSEQPQRVTLMIGFWGRAVHKECRREPYDACGPVPRPSRVCTWPSLMELPTDAKARAALDKACASARDAMKCEAVPRVDATPWQPIQGAGEGSEAGTSGARWVALPVPEARNHRFFVASLKEFREQIFNPPPVFQEAE